MVKNLPAKCRRHKRYGFNPWVRKIPWRRKWLPTTVILPGESHGQRSLVGYSPWGCKKCSYARCISINNCYVFLMTRPLYHYIMSIFVSHHLFLKSTLSDTSMATQLSFGCHLLGGPFSILSFVSVFLLSWDRSLGGSI